MHMVQLKYTYACMNIYLYFLTFYGAFLIPFHEMN